MPAATSAASRKVERRNRLRESVRWPVLLFHANGEIVECITENVSSRGLFFRSETCLDSGAVLKCALKIPRHGQQTSKEVLTILCQARVLRSNPIAADGPFGIACRIEEYHCIGASRPASRAEACAVAR